jgi:YebC/PmpR family DNA-binding regulatory protein
VSGHSKWSQIKHKKAKEDAKRGKIFSKLLRAITIAAKQGGGNPDTNIHLSRAIEKAKEFNVPQENIERAIKRGTGELSGSEQIEHLFYEGYAPGGVALLVEVVTDNRNRTASEIRNIFSRHGGNLGESGCVSWLFEKKGLISVEKSEGLDEDELFDIALEAGALDINIEDDYYEILTSAENFREVRDEIRKKGIKISSADLTMFPQSKVKVDGDVAKKVLKLVEALEEHDDVQEVYSNFDIPKEVFEEVVAGSK